LAKTRVETEILSSGTRSQFNLSASAVSLANRVFSISPFPSLFRVTMGSLRCRNISQSVEGVYFKAITKLEKKGKDFRTKRTRNVHVIAKPAEDGHQRAKITDSSYIWLSFPIPTFPREKCVKHNF
jgi:hypothetical protein